MARVFETQTIIVDPFAVPVTNVNLNKNFSVLEAAIITNIVKASGVREITLGLVYDDAVVSQASYSVFPILVGNNIADVIDSPITDVQTINFTEFIEASIVDDTMRLSLLTISVVGIQVNNYSAQVIQLDPANPITVGLPFGDTGTLKESHIVNVGSLDSNNTSQGTINSVVVTVSQA